MTAITANSVTASHEENERDLSESKFVTDLFNVCPLSILGSSSGVKPFSNVP